MRDWADPGAIFNFPINDALFLEVLSHITQACLFTILVEAGDAPALEAVVAVFFLLPEVVDFYGALKPPQPTTKGWLEQ